eukprot:TRINITY_DN8500_c1_g2_i1.p1 TRINITY_DN8500_c1_g2~~TRINITY_DN8500_c1_g2_i1.p1  ORF type:complete len:349 (-),score=86.06 TRINITY_DN8500_c1_g2_i1:117-1163(-)
MGQSVSHAAAQSGGGGPLATPLPPNLPPPPLGSGAADAADAGKGKLEKVAEEKDPEEKERVDYLHLPLPIKYEEIQREAIMSLKPELFEGLRFEFNKPLNQNFSLTHSVYMGAMEVPSQAGQVYKVPNSTYEFGSNVIDNRMMLIGRLSSDGRLSARMAYNMTDSFSVKLNAQLTNEPHFSQGMVHLEHKGGDYQAQLQMGNNAFYGFNYIQSITPQLSLGGEAFWLGHQRRSGIGIAARHNTDKVIATAQVASTGMVSLTYVQRVSDKVALAADMMYNWNNKEASTSVGYDYILRQCRLRGRIDSNGGVAAYLEEQLNAGVKLLLSAEVDHAKKDYRFGFGMTVGEF